MLRPGRAVRPAIAVLMTVAIAGCGLGAGPGRSDVSVVVTRNFGSAAVKTLVSAKVPGSETVLQLMERHFTVGVKYGGGFVESIAGRSGDSDHHDWFYYVNGELAPFGAGTTAVGSGDRIWWDLHDWIADEAGPAAVVGSYPAPFINARRPVVLECAADASAACGRVRGALAAAHVRVARGGLGDGAGGRLSVLVGTWAELRPATLMTGLAHGPAGNGIYARFTDDGHALALLDPHGDSVSTLTAGAGLVAATALGGSGAPAWIVSGTDLAGVDAAAGLVTAARLHDHFAVAVDGARMTPVPVDPGS